MLSLSLVKQLLSLESLKTIEPFNSLACIFIQECYYHSNTGLSTVSQLPGKREGKLLSLKNCLFVFPSFDFFQVCAEVNEEKKYSWLELLSCVDEWV